MSAVPKARERAHLKLHIGLQSAFQCRLYVGFARLNQLRFIARDPILTGILQVTRLPPQSTLWRFLASLHLNVAKQILSIQRQLRERVWAAAQVKLLRPESEPLSSLRMLASVTIPSNSI